MTQITVEADPAYIDSRASAVVQTAFATQKNVTLNRVAAPTSGGLAVSTGSPGNITGNTQYKITFVTATGETELGPASTIAGPVSSQVQLTEIPTGPAGVIARKIYRENIGQGEVARYLTTLNDNTTTTFLDNIPLGSATEFPLNINTTGGVVFDGDMPIMVADKATTIFGFNTGVTCATENNSFFGVNVAAGQTTGYWNSGFGFEVLRDVTTGYENSAFGVNCLRDVTTGWYNSAFGVAAGRDLTTGSMNTFFGIFSGLRTNGANCAFFGALSGQELTTATGTVCIGQGAARYLADGATAHTSNVDGIYIGNDSRPSANGTTNEIVIGKGAIGEGTNTVSIGSASTTSTRLRGACRSDSFVARSSTSGQTGFYALTRGNGTRAGYIGNDSDNQVGLNNEVGGGFSFLSSSTSANSTFNHNVTFQQTATIQNLIVSGSFTPVRINFTGNDSWISFTDGQNYLSNTTFFRTIAGGTKGTIEGSTGNATFDGKLSAGASTTARSSLRLPHGTAPTSPQDGDMWTTTAGLYVRINGSTVGPLS